MAPKNWKRLGSGNWCLGNRASLAMRSMSHGRSKLLLIWLLGSTASTRGWCRSKACIGTVGGSGGDGGYEREEEVEEEEEGEDDDKEEKNEDDEESEENGDDE